MKLIIATIFTLSILTSQVSAGIDDAIKAIPRKIVNLLNSAKSLTDFEEVSITQNYEYRFNFTLNNLSFELDEDSVVNKLIGPSVFQVSFDLVPNDMSLEGKIYYFTRLNNSIWYQSDMRGILNETFRIKIDAFFNKKILIIKDKVVSSGKPITDFNRIYCSQSVCSWSENRAYVYLTTGFPDRIKTRIHKLCYESASKIANELLSLF